MLQEAIDFTGLGPYSGDPEGRIVLKRESHGRSFGVVASFEAARVLDLVRESKALARAQVQTLLGIGRSTAGRHLNRLWRLGFLDRLTLGPGASLFALGPEAYALFNLRPEEWDTLRLLRVAAVNQLHCQFHRVHGPIHFVVEPHLGVTASCKIADREYGILAPRLWPGELDWCIERFSLYPVDGRLIIVAASERQAAELARVLPDGVPTRFTWDALLENGLSFLRREGKRLIAAEEFIPPEKNTKAPAKEY